MSDQLTVSGVLQINEKGFGFLRQAASNYLPGPSDVFVTRNLIQKFALREGVFVSGEASPSQTGRGKTQSDQMTSVEQINGLSPEEYLRRPEFTDLVSVDPTECLELSRGNDNISLRVIDLIAPIGKGQRGLIVAPPKTGKTTLIEEIAGAVADNHPETYLVMLLVDERPEEVTHMKRRVRGEVIASSSDQGSTLHLQIARLLLERVKRMVECGQDVVMLLDSITRLARASNRETDRRGKTMSGGVDSRAMEFPRRFFGAARKAELGGSLTIIGTALIDTGSQMDEVIFQEFKGTGNLEIVLDRRLSERRIFPSIDISKSGTRKEEKLFDAETLPKITLLRRALANKKPVEAMEMLLKGLGETRSNLEFLERIKLEE
ncbi:MAG TPA: transcription termination factor Rho [Blastocatellia bacterium]|nr:transcription termination factor Rho [Blastocatellia bacterium]